MSEETWEFAGVIGSLLGVVWFQLNWRLGTAHEALKSYSRKQDQAGESIAKLTALQEMTTRSLEAQIGHIDDLRKEARLQVSRDDCAFRHEASARMVRDAVDPLRDALKKLMNGGSIDYLKERIGKVEAVVERWSPP